MTEEEIKNQDSSIVLDPSTSGIQNNPDKLEGNTGYYGGKTVDPIVNVSDEESQQKIDSRRRMRRTTFQARLGRKLDHIHQMTLDNNLRLSAHPTDMLRISVKRDERSRDIISRTLEAMEIMPIIFPRIESIPDEAETIEDKLDVLREFTTSEIDAIFNKDTTITITFIPVGFENESFTEKHTVNQDIVLPDVTSIENHKLQGWYKSSKCTPYYYMGTAGDTVDINRSLILYGKMEEVE